MDFFPSKFTNTSTFFRIIVSKKKDKEGKKTTKKRSSEWVNIYDELEEL